MRLSFEGNVQKRHIYINKHRTFSIVEIKITHGANQLFFHDFI